MAKDIKNKLMVFEAGYPTQHNITLNPDDKLEKFQSLCFYGF